MPLFGPSGGGVTSVGLSSAGVLYSVSGSPITSSGTLALNLLSQTANTVLAGPTSGGSATPTMRALVSGDIPAHDASLLTSGTLALARLSGITQAQLAASAGILGSQLDAAAGITSGQISGLAASKLTGANTLPDGVLSTNVPLLSAANTFAAAQTIAGSVAASKQLVVKGAASQSGTLIEWQNSASTQLGYVRNDGAIITPSLVPLGGLAAYISLVGGGSVSILGNNPAVIPALVKGSASQTADLLTCQDSASHTQFAVANTGSGGSPVWGLRVRAVANAESAAVAHTLGAYSGLAIKVIDDASGTVGWLPLYA